MGCPWYLMAKDCIPQYPEITVFITYRRFNQELVVFCYAAIVRKVRRDKKRHWAAPVDCQEQQRCSSLRIKDISARSTYSRMNVSRSKAVGGAPTLTTRVL